MNGAQIQLLEQTPQQQTAEPLHENRWIMYSMDTSKTTTANSSVTALGTIQHFFSRMIKDRQQQSAKPLHWELWFINSTNAAKTTRQTFRRSSRGNTKVTKPGKSRETSIASPEKIATNQMVRIHRTNGHKSTSITKGTRRE